MPLEGALLLSFVLYSSVLIAACILVSHSTPWLLHRLMCALPASPLHQPRRHRILQDIVKMRQHKLKAHQ